MLHLLTVILKGYERAGAPHQLTTEDIKVGSACPGFDICKVLAKANGYDLKFFPSSAIIRSSYRGASIYFSHTAF